MFLSFFFLNIIGLVLSLSLFAIVLLAKFTSELNVLSCNGYSLTAGMIFMFYLVCFVHNPKVTGYRIYGFMIMFIAGYMLVEQPLSVFLLSQKLPLVTEGSCQEYFTIFNIFIDLNAIKIDNFIEVNALFPEILTIKYYYMIAFILVIIILIIAFIQIAQNGQDEF